MIILIAFAFLAGIITILSPCILPILPIILSSSIGGKETDRARPVGVVVGFILSFTFFTLFLSTLVKMVGISPDVLRTASVFVIAGFGITLLISPFQLFIERLFSKVTRLLPQGNKRAGLVPGLLIGLSLGLLWTPCVGPILASVISLAITGTVTFDAFIITFAYSLGTAIPMFFVMIGGNNLLQKIPWLVSNTAKIQKGFGVVMIVTAIGIFFNVDRTFQTYVLNTFPQYGVGLTKFEDNKIIKQELKKISTKKMDETKRGPLAPEIIPGGEWFNSKPLTLTELKGKVVIIDFWTYTCINCQRTFPYLKEWWRKYKDNGLVIIGVHAPEFEFEKDKNNLAKAIADFGLTYPIVQDNEFSTWRAYDNHYWPAKYIIDKDGVIRSTHFGEGDYDETEQIIQELLKETGAKNIPSTVGNMTTQTFGRTPETYLGANRIAYFSSPETIQKNSFIAYSYPSSLSDNAFALKGKWNIMADYAVPQKGSELVFNFDAKEVFLVMKIVGNPTKVKVYVDDKMQYFGEHNINGIVIVDSDKLYKLILLPSPGKHQLKLQFEDSNAQLFAFTFG
ncbi:cytochrome c biogenesis protein DipZ [Candidatus Roizmanbacteria bacterium]|nr:cytochrome c biogenesis protein DipZ [Candidatus Roizmanbacteria bacterium]